MAAVPIGTENELEADALPYAYEVMCDTGQVFECAHVYYTGSASLKMSVMWADGARHLSEESETTLVNVNSS